MNRCYGLFIKNIKESAVAFLPENKKINDADLFKYIKENKTFPTILKLKRSFITSKGIIYDENISKLSNLWEHIQCNEFSYSMFSETIKTCIDEQRTKLDDFEWIEVVIEGNGENRKYYVPFFNYLPDVIDEKNTTYSSNKSIIVPCFSSEKIENYSIFPVARTNWMIPSTIYVSDKIKKNIQKKKLPNIIFENIRCSENGILVKKH